MESTTSNISETEEEGDAEDTQQVPEEEMGVVDNQPGPEENPSSQSAATVTLQRQRVPIRSVGDTASKGSKRRGKQKHDMDGAMLPFMEEMRGMRRADTNDPFSDPNNEDATFVRSLYHHLLKVPTPRKMDVQMAIYNFIGVCIRAAMSGDHMPPVISPLQRPYHSEQAPPPTFHHP